MATNKKLSRRSMLKLAGMSAAGATLAACGPATVVVTKEVEKIVTQEKVVTEEKIVEVTSTPTMGMTNALGMEYPPDALPLEKQYWPTTVGTTGGGFGHIMESLYNRAFEHNGGQDTLTTLNLDGEVVGHGAESWTQSDDGLSWDFKLRKELTWSDGTPVTAHDWEYTLKWSIGRGYDFGWFYTDIVGVQEVLNKAAEPDTIGIKAIDDYTLRITTKNITPYTPSLGVWFYPGKKDIWETAGDNWALDPARYVACGPFTLKEFNRGIKNLWVPEREVHGRARSLVDRDPRADHAQRPAGLHRRRNPELRDRRDLAARRNRLHQRQPGFARRVAPAAFYRDGLHRLQHHARQVPAHRQSRCAAGAVQSARQGNPGRRDLPRIRQPGLGHPAQGLPGLLRRQTEGTRPQQVRSRGGQAAAVEGRLPGWQGLPQV